MISQLRLKNFQAHKNTVLDFNDGINVITGQSDQGKSSIIRALYWLFFNRPSGNEFLKWGENSCSVTAKTKEHTIKRTKSDKRNSYIIDGQIFNAVRTDVPTELKEIINITPTNIALQDDSYFLLSLQPGEVARKLNQVAGIDQIDSSLQYVNRIIKQQSSEINHLEKEIDQKKEELKKLDPIENLKEIYNKYENLVSLIMNREYSLKSVKEVQSRILDLEKTFKMEKDAQTVESYLIVMNNLLKTIERCIERSRRLIYLRRTIERTKSKVSKINHHQKDAENKLATMKKLLNLEDPSKVFYQIERILTYENKIEELSSRIDESEQEIEGLKEELQICPLCGNTFKNCSHGG